jgi:hypothetical protein
MRERSGRQDVPQRSGPNGLARRASAANATTESGGEAEIAGGGGVRHGAATRSLRSARGAAHSGAPRVRPMERFAAEGVGGTLCSQKLKLELSPESRQRSGDMRVSDRVRSRLIQSEVISIRLFC